MISSPSKRAASRTPDGRPSKRPAPSSPEEGELDSDAAPSPPPPNQRSVTPPSPAAESSSKKIAFPFKSKAKAAEEDASTQAAVNGSKKVVYERPEDLDRRLREEGGLGTSAYDHRRRPPRDTWGGGRDRYARSPHHHPSRRNWDRRDGPHESHAYYPPRDHHYPPEEDRDRRYDYLPPPLRVERYPSREREHDRDRDHAREASRTPPTRSPTRSATGRSPSPAASRKEKHRLPAPRSPVGGFSPPSDTRHWEPDRERERERKLRSGRGKRHDGVNTYRPGDAEQRYDRGYDRGYDRDPGGHYRREADAYEQWSYRPDAYGYDRDRYRDYDDRYDRRDRYDYPRDSYGDIHRPVSPRPPPDREPSTPIPPLPASMAPRASPAPPDAAPPPPPLLGDRKKDETLPPEHATISIAVPKRDVATLLESVANEAEAVKLTGDVGDKPLAPQRRRRVPLQRTREEEKEAYGRMFAGCGKQSDYELMAKLGEGTFGEVHKAVHKAKGHVVALKRILMHNEKEGMPVTALREIKILKALNHPCIVNILDMFVVRSTKDSPLSVYMVFPYMDHDLAGLLENERVKLSPSQIKLYMKQLLEGTEYMHRNRILHRDMKAANLLISNQGSLQIADFGLARAFDPNIVRDPKGRDGRDRKYTNCVVTRWYRPPELLLGARQYGGEVDIWGIGCVLGEMFMRRPILPGSSDLDQLDRIWQLCGTPNQQTWPNYDALPGCEGVKRFAMHPRRIKSVYEMIGPETNDLLDKLLTCNPSQRITAAQALDHEYFWTDPLPADPRSLPQYEPSHELDKRSRRQHPGGPPPDGNVGVPGPLRPLPPQMQVVPAQPVALPPIHYPRTGPPPPARGPPAPHGMAFQGVQPGHGPPRGGYGGPPPYAHGPPREYGPLGAQGGVPLQRPPMARGGPLPPPPQSGGLNYD